MEQVEQQVDSERHVALTACLMLVSGVKKVEAATRMGIDLSEPLAAEVFSTLDDIISWIDRPFIRPRQQREKQAMQQR
jgi:hypothetical protein